MRFRFFGSDGVGKMNVARGKVIANHCRGDGVNNAKRSWVGLAIGLQGPAEDFHGWSGGEFVPGYGLRWECENQLHAIARLVGSQIGNGCGDRWRRRSGFAGSATPGNKEENGN